MLYINYHASFTAIKEVKIPEVKDINSVGINMRINSFITFSDKKKRQKPKFMKKSKRIAHWQRITARRTKDSGRKEKSKLKLQKEYQHINNQSNDYLHKTINMHKTINKLIKSDYASFVIEKLNIQNMVRNHNLAKSICFMEQINTTFIQGLKVMV